MVSYPVEILYGILFFMQHSIIVTTTQSFLRAIEHSELKSEIEKEGFSVVFADSSKSPKTTNAFRAF
jgi:hypothetical protein